MVFISLIYELYIYIIYNYSVSPKDLITIINTKKFIILDIRNEILFNSCHIANSRNIKNISTFTNVHKYKNYTIIIISESDFKSYSVVKFLNKKGFKCVFLRGGILSWKSYGIPTQKIKNF
jgi:rhodanese-related sulfurtransferase